MYTRADNLIITISYQWSKGLTLAKVEIITDSTAFLQPGEVEKLGIHMVPLSIRLGGDQFLDGAEIDSDELAHRLEYGAPFPTSVPPDATKCRNR